MNILNIQLLLEVHAHTMLSVKALMIMGKVKSTSDFQDTSASLDGASNTLFGPKIRSHMQKHFAATNTKRANCCVTKTWPTVVGHQT